MRDFKKQTQEYLMPFNTAPSVYQPLVQANYSIRTDELSQLLKELRNEKKMLQEKSEDKENILRRKSKKSTINRAVVAHACCRTHGDSPTHGSNDCKNLCQDTKRMLQ